MPGGRRAAAALVLIAAFSLGSTVSAHRRDECLQAARLSVEPGRVDLELDLTPGTAVAGAIIADIDRDRNGVLSADEKRAWLGRVLDGLVLELDGRALHMDAIGSTFPDLDAIRGGEGVIRLQSASVLPRQADGDHQLVFRNTNQRDVSVYLANALMPISDRVSIAAEHRDPAQRNLTIDYVLRGGSPSSVPTWLLGGLAGMTVLAALLMRPSKPA